MCVAGYPWRMIAPCPAGGGTSRSQAAVPSVLALGLPSFPRAAVHPAHWPDLSTEEKASWSPARQLLQWPHLGRWGQTHGDGFSAVSVPLPHCPIERRRYFTACGRPCSHIPGFCLTQSRLVVPGRAWNTQQPPEVVCTPNKVPFLGSCSMSGRNRTGDLEDILIISDHSGVIVRIGVWKDRKTF